MDAISRAFLRIAGSTLLAVLLAGCSDGPSRDLAERRAAVDADVSPVDGLRDGQGEVSASQGRPSRLESGVELSHAESGNSAETGPRASAGAGEGWSKVLEPRQLIFPADHGPHPDYRIEWWYYTGNLDTRDGRRFGYQLTFFRTGMQRQPVNPSRWVVHDLYVAHFAIADLEQGKLSRFERASRGGIGWSGADATARRIWNGDWELKVTDEEHHLSARQEGCSIQLSLRPSKNPVLHGDRGLSRKGEQPGNASYYYSFTRMETSGQLAVGGNAYDVRGDSWMDHEFSSSFLERGQQGWDWFSLQLDGNRELMLYQIRNRDGNPDPRSSGTWVLSDGRSQPLAVQDFTLTPGRWWRSPTSGGEYPLQWLARIPSLDAELTVAATFPEQEMDTRASTGIVYWEGTVDATGRLSGNPVRGRGYLEMTGYAPGKFGGLLE